MRKIRVKICGYDDSEQDFRDNFIYKILIKYYDVEISEKPDYVFYNESSYKYLKYNCVRIFYTGENVSPNFNLCDYAVGYDYMIFGDRYYRYPLYHVMVFYDKNEAARIGPDFTKPEPFTRADLAQKTEFCSFVYSNYLADERRKNFFDKLSQYKKISAGGRYLNNVGGIIESKLDFESKHKFSIAFENSSRLGYTTEKIASSIAARTIPIYWGNPEIGREFNDRRFISCHNYESFDRVVARVKEIDNDDDLYLEIINQPIVAPGADFEKVKQGFEDFLRNIIDQPLPAAKRRTINPAKALELEKNERLAGRRARRRTAVKRFMAKLYRPLKKIKILEMLKQNYFIIKKRGPKT
ncbi:hypothetical protein EPN28_00380 [Patescibacteria group bacterium]|nr:MAG: hypothetical protein EPN28_00380 [Patescibacteria group bacterium]